MSTMQDKEQKMIASYKNITIKRYMLDSVRKTDYFVKIQDCPLYPWGSFGSKGALLQHFKNSGIDKELDKLITF